MRGLLRLSLAVAASSVLSRSHQFPSAAPARMEQAQQRAAEYELKRLHELMKDFVDAWNDFVTEYVERGTFNLKKARKVREAWMRLERANAFPK